MLFNLVPIGIMLGGGYFLIRLRAFFMLHPRKTASHLLSHCKNERKGSFRRMSLALAGTLGVGNVTGVAAGILIGGAGSVFWLFLSAFVSAPLKYAESVAVLSLPNKEKERKFGFPAFVRRRFSLFGAPLAWLYAALSVLLAFSMGSALQGAAVAETARALGGAPASCAATVIFVMLLFLFVFGTSEKICKIISFLIPAAMILYTVLCIYTIFFNISRFSAVISLVFKEAFSVKGIVGGTVGAASQAPLREGFLRGLLSNEAGAGTSAYAHAKSESPDPVAEGLLGMGEILFDTVLLCMLTAFSILLSVDDPASYKNGMALLSAAFSSVLPRSYALSLFASVFLFALSTAVCWFEYGRCALSFLGKRNGALFLFSYVFMAGCGARLGSMAMIPMCDTVLFCLVAIALPALIKNGTATCRITEQALKIRLQSSLSEHVAVEKRNI